jgi:hypothetical protein
VEGGWPGERRERERKREGEVTLNQKRSKLKKASKKNCTQVSTTALNSIDTVYLI